jgi:sphinganine-1-phosphate aldolase
MEAEIVSMCLKMYRGPEGSAGVMTSGGTESIVMSIKTYRDWARKVKGITEPEMSVSHSTKFLELSLLNILQDHPMHGSCSVR